MGTLYFQLRFAVNLKLQLKKIGPIKTEKEKGSIKRRCLHGTS